MMYDELIKRLRNIANSDGNIKSNYIGLSLLQAANAIEGLSHAVDQMIEWRKNRWIPVTERLPKEKT